MTDGSSTSSSLLDNRPSSNGISGLSRPVMSHKFWIIFRLVWNFYMGIIHGFDNSALEQSYKTDEPIRSELEWVIVGSIPISLWWLFNSEWIKFKIWINKSQIVMGKWDWIRIESRGHWRSIWRPLEVKSRTINVIWSWITKSSRVQTIIGSGRWITWLFFIWITWSYP